MTLQTKFERGVVLHQQGKLVEAERIYREILRRQPKHFGALHLLGVIALQTRRTEHAIELIKKAIGINPNIAAAHNNLGNALQDLNHFSDAIASFDRAIVLKPDYADAYYNRGNALKQLKRFDDALASYDKAIALKPNYAEAYNNRGNVLKDELKRLDEAFASYDKAFGLKPDLLGLEGARLHLKMRLFNWDNLETECAHLNLSVLNGKTNTEPFCFLGISSSPKDQLECAKFWVAERFPLSQNPCWRGERYNHDRIRIAYVSADFRHHAVSFLIVGMLESHDKSRFDVTAISLGPSDNSEIGQRSKGSFAHFVDATTLSDVEIASLIKKTEIDILIDLSGFTKGGRTNVFALRPAPIQVNYLGYPGTMGASYIDYIIADQTVIPNELRKFYSEKIAFLPNTYQANDRKRMISDKAFTRSDLGLPSQGFVFCCFNNNYKITPGVFECWMRILRQVEDGVLWLVASDKAVEKNLRMEAAARGVDGGRLVFAPRIPYSEHLARLSLANLFLDTAPFNAGTTASDALWAGLPILTRVGDSFAGRMAASLLNAIGLPELITTTLEAYEQMAVDLAAHPEKLMIIKRKLAENRLTTPLFDTKFFTKHIEAAYITMYERYHAGLQPDHIVVPN
jgi:predicted O-linked N-acetylglucosamine transferase (SPINDLY family)